MLRSPDGARNPGCLGTFVLGHPRILGLPRERLGTTIPGMERERLRRTRDKIVRLAHAGLDWVTFAAEATEDLRRALPFDRSCWHIVDPGTVLFTGSLNQQVGCSGAWLAEYEYVIEDVNKWSFLARSGRRAGATSLATHGDLSRSARHRSHEAYGIGDELRGSFVVDGAYWGAAGFLRDRDRPWFTEDDVRFLASLSEPIAAAFRRALLAACVGVEEPCDEGPGVVVFDERGHAESISPAAERWIAQMIEVPPPRVPADSKMVQVVAARARALHAGQDPLELAARSRVRTKSGRWLLLYGTRLSGGAEGRTAVIIQPAAVHEVAPLVTLAYGLSERECQITRLCMTGQSTKEIAQTLGLSPYTVQDHLKSIFTKTGARSRGELVGQIFLQHYVPRWEELSDAPPGWFAKAIPTTEAIGGRTP
jgi:DNA-binding CsgD family transcriptional regulator